MKQHERAIAMRLPPEHASLTVEGLESLTNITKLSMEAVNAMNEVGHTPAELVAIIRELRGVLKRYNNLSGDDIFDITQAYLNFEADVKAALAKTEDFA